MPAIQRVFLAAPTMLLAALVSFLALSTEPARAQNIVDQWASVKPPPPPELKPVTVDPKTTALLMLDFVKPSCNPERGSRCVATLPAVKKLLDEARGKDMLVVYSAYGKLTQKDIVPEVAPNGSEPFVVSSVNKYLRTDLEKILKDKGIQTVITVGTFAHGAVLTTAGASAERGFNVIVPIDGMSFDNLYAEQYTAWHLSNAPGIGNKTTLTKIDMMKF